MMEKERKFKGKSDQLVDQDEAELRGELLHRIGEVLSKGVDHRKIRLFATIFYQSILYIL
jgi:hypothetical protein